MLKNIIIKWLISRIIIALVFSLVLTMDTYSAADVLIVEERLPEAQLKVTGKGYPPRRGKSTTQRRLLAQRAATLDAYRTLAATLNGISGYIHGGTGALQTSGYIQGARVSQVRNYSDGKTEVDLVLPVNLIGKEVGGRLAWDGIVRDINRQGYQSYYLVEPKGQITEEEWLQLIEKKSK